MIVRGAFVRASSRCLVGLWILGAALGAVAEPPQDRAEIDQGTSEHRTCETLSRRQAKVRFHKKRWDLRKSGDLRRLAAVLETEIEATAQTSASGKSPDKHRGASDRRALLAMRSLAAQAMSSDGSSCESLAVLAELSDSLELDTWVPIPRRRDLVQVPFYYLDLMHNPVGKGHAPARNLPPSAATTSDSSLLDPVPSTFWSRPKDIPSRDLYEAFGPILSLGDEPCTYDEPKTSYGTTPGFQVTCGVRQIKVKFGAEASSRDTEVAVTRLYDALGFHVEPNDYAPEIRVRYDRRILLEFNSRKDLSMKITAFGFIPVARIRIQAAEDPFHYIRSAVMKDGEVLSPEVLAAKLLRRDVLERSPRKAKKRAPGTRPDDYREDAAAFERELDHLVMSEANVQARDGAGQNVGPWGWNRLDHSGRRELRGAALLSAWTNYFDARWDNNRLKLVDGEDGSGILHYISDLGGSLGRAENFRVDAQGLLNDFPWTFTEGPPFRIVRYQPIDDNDAFREMTLDDARWMARLIAQLTENQIEQALIATGFTSAEVRLYTEKLVNRRDAMIRDLGLSEEIAPLRPNGIVRTFDYDPKKDGPVVARARDGSELTPIESRDQVVRSGRVEPR